MITEPQRTLSSFLGTEVARNTTLEPILGGESSARLFRFSHGGQTYVLRLLAPKMSRERHHHEVGLTHATGAIEVGPRVRFVASDESAIVYDYTPGRTISLRDVKQVPILDHLANQLSRLHRSGIEIPSAVSPFERFRGFEQLAADGGVIWPQAMTRAREYLTTLEDELQYTELCPCHLDLHARNIILTPSGNTMLIDWVNGGLSDPALDIATLFVFLGQRNEALDGFLSSYQASMGESVDMGRGERLMPVRPFVAAASSLKSFPAHASTSQLEEEMARDEPPGHELFTLPLADRPKWPMWKWGLVALEMGLSHVPYNSAGGCVPRALLRTISLAIRISGFRLDQAFLSPSVSALLRRANHRWGGGSRRAGVSDHAAVIVDL